MPDTDGMQQVEVCLVLQPERVGAAYVPGAGVRGRDLELVHERPESKIVALQRQDHVPV